ncbi:MAG: hypothetical protein RLZZ200_310 [Pseudomonadota bacterium]|jgi:outer membrane lipoprotein carrier protein
MRIWFLCACLAFAGVALGADQGDTALDRFLSGLNTWSAGFSQSVTDARGKAVGKGEGSLVIVRPGRFRWEMNPQYASQSGQLLVADGKNLWFLDRDLEQVTVKPQGAALSQSPAMLLSGMSSVRDAFDLSSEGRSDGLDWVKALPRQKDGDFRVARFGFEGAELRRMLLEDKLGQKVTLRFGVAARNRPVDPSQVAFTLPAGADVIGTPVR